MSISFIISVAQIVVCVLLVTAVLFQQRGSSLGSAYGGGGASYYAKRGFEKVLFNATIVLGILLAGLTIAALLIK
jgi:protein translocase SecG subunit